MIIVSDSFEMKYDVLKLEITYNLFMQYRL